MGKWLLVSFVSLAMVGGCNGQKDAAEAAFAQVQASIAPVSADLAKYAPQEYLQLNVLLDAMKQQLNAQNYAQALALQPQVTKQLITVSGVAALHRQALGKQDSTEWKALVASVPALVLQLSERLGELQDQGASLPPGIAASSLQEVNAALPEISAEWSATVAAARGNNLSAAIDKARAIQKRCIELGARLGLKPV